MPKVIGNMTLSGIEFYPDPQHRRANMGEIVIAAGRIWRWLDSKPRAIDITPAFQELHRTLAAQNRAALDDAEWLDYQAEMDEYRRQM